MSETLFPLLAGVVDFWADAGPMKWFAKDAEFDDLFRGMFADAHFAVARREYDHWFSEADGVLAILLLLDQFPRNAYRNTGHAFATDPLARYFARKALAEGTDITTRPELQRFIYLPFSHSEDPEDQDLAVALMEKAGEPAFSFAIKHRDIIHRFGRFPHRNAILGRVSTAAEKSFLKQGGFAG